VLASVTDAAFAVFVPFLAPKPSTCLVIESVR
jgi:hypothetical protein